MDATVARRIGRYEIIRELGRGGTAIVYEAMDPVDGGRVALKVLTPAAQMPSAQRDEMFARLQREARVIERMNHPGIVAVLDLGVDDLNPDSPLPYLVMELVPGETLAQRLERTGPLPPAEAVVMLEQIAAPLDAIHGAGIVHRDVKPSNIMLLPDGQAKLMDFGIARLNDDTMITRTGAIIGSPAFMSPEQAMGQPATAASDRWAFAALAYSALTGRLPFQGENIPAVLYQIIHGAPAPIEGAEPALNRAFEHAFARDPGARYPTASALAAAVRAALEHHDAPAPTPAAATTALDALPEPRPTMQPARRRNAAGLKLPLIVTLVSAPLALTLFAWAVWYRGTAGHRAAAATQVNANTLGGTIAGLRSKITPNSPPATPRASAAPILAAKAIPKKVTAASPRPTPKPTPSPVAVIAEATPTPLATPKPPSPRPKTPVRRTPTPMPVPTAAPAQGNEPPAGTASAGQYGDALSFVGVWHGTHSGHPAELVVKSQNRDSDKFEGTMTVRLPEGTVVLAVNGRLSDDTGEPIVTLEEKKVVEEPRSHIWERGTNMGRLTGADAMSGSGRNKRDQYYTWSLHR
jgi:serine/threonine protein kinase